MKPVEDLIPIVFGTIVQNVPNCTDNENLKNKALANKKILRILLDSGASTSIIHTSYVLKKNNGEMMSHMNGVPWRVRSKLHA